MGMVLSFLGGAAKQLTTDIEQAETNAREDAKLGFSALYKRYEENAKSNRELTSKMDEDKLWVKTNYASATPEQIAALVGNPIALEALKKTDDPYKIDLNNYIQIAQGNESAATAAERIKALPSLVGQLKESISSKIETPKNRSPLGGLINDFGETSYDSTMARLAKSQGMSMADLQATSRTQRKDTGATFNMSTLAKAPDSVEDMVKTANVARVQAKQKFGEGSEEYNTANKAYVEISNEVVKADKKLEDRRDRLAIERDDNKDKPDVVKALTKEINNLNKDIQANREATSTKRERNGEGSGANTYAKAKIRMEDYMNTDMELNKGLGWRKYVEDKVVKDTATGATITIPGKKANLTPEQEKEYIEGMTNARLQGLKELGLITDKGQPRNPEVKDLMISYKLTARPVTTPAEQPLPVANANTQTAPAPAQPATQPTKVVSAAKVQEQARANNVPYEQAAAEARKQGYTIR